MSETKIPTFKELMHDSHTEITIDAMLELGRALRDEGGLRPERIELAMVMASVKLARERGDQFDWLMTVRRYADGLLGDYEDLINVMEAERRRSAH